MTTITNLEDTFVTSIEDTCNKFIEETFVTSIEGTCNKFIKETFVTSIEDRYVTDKLRRHLWH